MALKFTKTDMINFRRDTSIGGTPFYFKYAAELTTIQMIAKWFEEHEAKFKIKQEKKRQIKKKKQTKPRSNHN